MVEWDNRDGGDYDKRPSNSSKPSLLRQQMKDNRSCWQHQSSFLPVEEYVSVLPSLSCSMLSSCSLLSSCSMLSSCSIRPSCLVRPSSCSMRPSSWTSSPSSWHYYNPPPPPYDRFVPVAWINLTSFAPGTKRSVRGCGGCSG